MMIIMKSGSLSEEIERVIQEIRSWSITPEKSVGYHKVVMGLVGDATEIDKYKFKI
ncbi:hypothetical protein [Scytonema hofmannii]|uniref:hypothetical protein n=1 Tax=Scytonema hofmannii TaxID=34078 RepID=UPI0003489697|nr:hypothetical protein [Scytonema hofmannii]